MVVGTVDGLALYLIGFSPGVVLTPVSYSPEEEVVVVVARPDWSPNPGVRYPTARIYQRG